MTAAEPTSSVRVSHADVASPRRAGAAIAGWIREMVHCRLCLKVGAAVLFGIVAIEAVILVPSVRNYERDMTDGLVREARATARSIAWIAGPNDEALAWQVIRETHVRGLVLYDLTGAPIMRVGERDQLGFAEARAGRVTEAADGARLLAGWGPEKLGAPVVVAARIDRSWIAGELWRFVARIIGLVLMISVFVTAVTMAILGRAVLLPVLGLRDTLDAAARDPESPERYVLPEGRRDEIGELTQAFNRMLRDVGRSHRQQVQRLAAMTEHSLAATFAYGLDGAPAYVNRAAARMCGVETEEALRGSAYPRVVVGDESVPLAEFLRCEPPPGEHVVETGPERTIPCLLSANAIAAEDGAPALYCVSLFDITEMHGYRAQLEQKNMDLDAANRAKSEFLAHMSHELRTPLNAIIGFSQMIEGEVLGPLGSESYREYASDIHESGTHLLAIISDILDISKIESGNAELSETLIDVGSLVSNCHRLVNDRAHRAALLLQVEVADTLPRLYADERMVKQMLLNLLTNAIKFTEAGGAITVRAEMAGDGLALSVADNGVGMSPEDLERALAPFGQAENWLTRNHEGTGLGLPLVQKLAALHDAEFEVETEPREGTTIVIRFPGSRVREVRRPAAGAEAVAAPRRAVQSESV